MGRDIPVDLDRFAVGLEQLIGDLPGRCDEALEKSVRQSVRRTAQNLRSGEYGASGRHEWSGEYMEGFTSHVTHEGAKTVGEVGNKAKPGLVHLLEKGHVTLNGRRTAAFPHMAPAFTDMEEDFIERAEAAIGAVLEG